MPPPSMSTQTLLAATNKMSITCGYPHRAVAHLRRHPQLVQQQRLRLLQQLQHATATATATATRLLPRRQRQLLPQRPHRLPQLHRRYGYSYSHSYGYGHINGNSYGYSQTDTDAEVSGDAEAAPHAPAETLIPH